MFTDKLQQIRLEILKSTIQNTNFLTGFLAGQAEPKELDPLVEWVVGYSPVQLDGIAEPVQTSSDGL